MKLKKLDPFGPEVTNAVIERISRMSPEEVLAFLAYRTPGIEETDMTGMLAAASEEKPRRSKRTVKAA